MARIDSFIRSLFSPAPGQAEAGELYIALTAHSRKAFFYSDCEVADTLDGRFELIVLHMFYVLQALEQHANVPAKPIQRALLEYFFADMDRSLREMGVGDMGISRRIKTMSKAAYGRFEAYKTAHSAPQWHVVLARNVYRGAEVHPQSIAALHNAMKNYSASLGEQLKF